MVLPGWATDSKECPGAVSWGPRLMGVGGDSLGMGMGTGPCLWAYGGDQCVLWNMEVVGGFSEALTGIKSCDAVAGESQSTSLREWVNCG